jgi:uncharacterized membrane protein
MGMLICGLVLFLGIHSISIFSDQWRNEQVAKLGALTWKIICSVISIAGLVLMTVGYLEVRPQPITIWSPPPWAWQITVYLSLVSLILIAAAYVPNNAIKLKLKDPMLVGVIVWAICHLTTIGSLAGILLFGSFLIWGIVDLISCRKRRAGMDIPESNQKTSSAMTFATIVVGFIVWAPFARIAYGIVRAS